MAGRKLKIGKYEREFRKSLRELILNEKRDEGLSLSQMARCVGLSEKTVHNQLQFFGRPTIDTVVRLLRFFGKELHIQVRIIKMEKPNSPARLRSGWWKIILADTRIALPGTDKVALTRCGDKYTRYVPMSQCRDMLAAGWLERAERKPQDLPGTYRYILSKKTENMLQDLKKGN
jgi:DNA-binding phage protein